MVVAILGLIGGIVGVAVGSAFDDASAKTAELQIKKLSEALDLYRIKFGRYPTTAEDSRRLKPPGNKAALIDSVPKDPGTPTISTSARGSAIQRSMTFSRREGWRSRHGG